MGGPMGRSEREQVAREHRAVDLRPPVADPGDLAEAVALAARLAAAAERDPSHPLVVAARAALEVADARIAAHRALREASLDVHDADPDVWRRGVLDVPFEELQRRRGLERRDGGWRPLEDVDERATG